MIRRRRRERVAPGDLRRTLRLFRRFMGSRRIYVVGFLLLVLEAATAVVEPYPIAYLIDFLQGARTGLRDLGLPTVLSSERLETILLLTVAIVLIAAVNSAADSLTEVCMARGGRSLGYSIRNALYAHLQRLPLAYHDKKRTGDVLTRVTGDVLVVEDFVVKSVSNIVGSLMVLVGSFAFLLTQSWNVALVAVVVIPMLAVVSNHFSRRIKVASKTQRDREGDLASTAQEMLTSIRLVQSYGRGKLDLDRFSSQTAKSMDASVGAANIQAQFSFVIALVEALSISAVIWLGVWLVDRNAITVGTLVLFVLLLQNMFKPARKIVSEWYKIGKVFASVERIEDLLDREIGVQDSPDAVEAPRLQGRLTFRHVGFTYPSEHDDEARSPVLRDVDFEVAPGEVVALVGPSGAGKSTIAQLVPRLYDPDEGEVLVDGHPVRQLTLASLRGQVSLVLQETMLLSGTVAENIGYGIDGATAADIEAAARMANAHEFISALPDGYATKLGERGSTLSGGQRQRLAIARAFIRRAPLLILDEPTTGLDTESAQSVVDALRNLMRGTTTIVISHDPSLIRCADRVLVVADGSVVAAESRADLGYAPHDGSGVAFSRLDAGKGEQPARMPAAGNGTGPPAAAKPDPGAMARPTLTMELLKTLPGLRRAADPALVARHLEGHLLGKQITVDDVEVGGYWVREDGSCSVRYRLRLTRGSGEILHRTVLGRVHRDDDEAGAYHATVEELSNRPPDPAVRSWPPSPWRTTVSSVPGSGLVLHPFPVDPALPTLPAAGHPAVAARWATLAGASGAPEVDVVHHARDGACVLRFRFADGDAARDPGRTMYGKVYGDAGGDAASGFLVGYLVALGQQHAEGHRERILFPRPVGYLPELRMLVTRGLPGSPLLVELMKAVLGRRHTSEGVTAQLTSVAQASGRGLAALHASDLATAPVRDETQDGERLRRELRIVERFLPASAERMCAAVEELARDTPARDGLVLSHGDFTPSQVLLDGGSVGILDLDTLCWAEPALDLGRFLAHVQLRAAKLGGAAGEPVVERVTEGFLHGYGEGAPLGYPAPTPERIAHHTAVSLVQSALNASRQLKDDRLELTLRLLDPTPRRRAEL